MEKERKTITILSLLGSINSFFLGFYLSTTISEIIGYSKNELKAFYSTHLAITIFVTITIVFLTSLGTYFSWKKHFKRGGILNFVGGIILLVIYIYYTFIFEPSLLSWLGPIAYILPLLPILSGCFGISMKK